VHIDVNQSDKVFAALLYAAEEYRTVTADDVLDAAEEMGTIHDPPGRRTVVDHCNSLSEAGILRTVSPGRWRFIGRYDPS
jgi:hypothetical protein